MDIGKAVTFVYEDEQWLQKVSIGIGVLILSSILSIAIVGILGYFIVIGYCLRLTENVRDNQPNPLPEWDQWAEDLMRGLKLAVVGLVWALPIILLMLPIAVGSVITGSSEDAAPIGLLIIMCSSCLTVLYGLALVVLAPGITLSFIRDDKINSGLMISEIWSWTVDNIGQVIIIALIVVAAGFVISTIAGIAGILLCGIGLIVTVPLGSLLVYLFQYHLFGQLAHAYPMYSADREFEAPQAPEEDDSAEEGLAPSEENGDDDAPKTTEATAPSEPAETEAVLSEDAPDTSTPDDDAQDDVQQASSDPAEDDAGQDKPDTPSI